MRHARLGVGRRRLRQLEGCCQLDRSAVAGGSEGANQRHRPQPMLRMRVGQRTRQQCHMAQPTQPLYRRAAHHRLGVAQAERMQCLRRARRPERLSRDLPHDQLDVGHRHRRTRLERAERAERRHRT